jgi:hypothetical protein
MLKTLKKTTPLCPPVLSLDAPRVHLDTTKRLYLPVAYKAGPGGWCTLEVGVQIGTYPLCCAATLAHGFMLMGNTLAPKWGGGTAWVGWSVASGVHTRDKYAEASRLGEFLDSDDPLCPIVNLNALLKKKSVTAAIANEYATACMAHGILKYQFCDKPIGIVVATGNHKSQLHATMAAIKHLARTRKEAYDAGTIEVSRTKWGLNLFGRHQVASFTSTITKHGRCAAFMDAGNNDEYTRWRKVSEDICQNRMPGGPFSGQYYTPVTMTGNEV